MSEDFPALLAGLRPGSLVAGYRLEAHVGAGGMAVVFRARDERLGRLVALKVLAPALAADPAFRRRFIAESRAAATVDDPHIIPIYEAGEAEGALFIAMRFVRGGDLRGLLDREGALPPARAAAFISPVAAALDAAHGAGLVHRDVKPANILVDARAPRPDHVYLSDFGVSKGAISSVSLTGTGYFLGTPDYSAPEQIQGLAVDGRADQYALACVAYQLLTGGVPFQRDQGMAVLLAHLSEPPPPLAARRSGLPAAADRVLARALAKAPEHRYASCTEFADALREALGLAPYTSPGGEIAGGARPTAGTGPTAHTGPAVTPVASSGVPASWPTYDRAPFERTIDSERPPSGPPDPAGPPVLAGPSGHGRTPRPSRSPGSIWARRLAPVAAAAAIAAIVVAVVAAVDSPKSRPGASTGHTPRASASAKPTRLAYALGGRVPPYYVWTTFTSNPNLNYVRVRLTATGAVLGTVKAAAGGTIVAATGAADDRTFVLDEQSLATGNANQSWEPHTFYLLRLAASGVPSSVTQLPITEPSGALVSGVTLSPDGTKLAVAISPNNVKSEPNLTDVKIYSIATGTVLRTWSANGTIGYSGEREALTWSSDQRTLGFVWQGLGLISQASEQGEWLLNLSLNGTDLISNSREAMSLVNNLPFGCGADLIITPDASAVVCPASPNDSHAAPETVFYEFSTANRKLVRTLAQVAGNANSDVLWSNPSGSVLIGVAGQDQVGMVTAGTFTPLPGLVYGEAAQGTW